MTHATTPLGPARPDERYGRSLSETEDQARTAFAAADAAGTLAYGPRDGDALVTAQSRRTVERLPQEGCP
ncbi:hypothetical protein ACWD5V_40245 [Streptomyces sp. NPDC002523]